MSLLLTANFIALARLLVYCFAFVGDIHKVETKIITVDLAKATLENYLHVQAQLQGMDIGILGKIYRTVQHFPADGLLISLMLQAF